jgi:hypothetical protein
VPKGCATCTHCDATAAQSLCAWPLWPANIASAFAPPHCGAPAPPCDINQHILYFSCEPSIVYVQQLNNYGTSSWPWVAWPTKPPQKVGVGTAAQLASAACRLQVQLRMLALVLAKALQSTCPCRLVPAVGPTEQPLTAWWSQHWTHSSRSSYSSAQVLMRHSGTPCQHRCVAAMTTGELQLPLCV